MQHRIHTIAFALAIAGALSACADSDDSQAAALAKWKRIAGRRASNSYGATQKRRGNARSNRKGSKENAWVRRERLRTAGAA